MHCYDCEFSMPFINILIIKKYLDLSKPSPQKLEKGPHSVPYYLFIQKRDFFFKINVKECVFNVFHFKITHFGNEPMD